VGLSEIEAYTAHKARIGDTLTDYDTLQDTYKAATTENIGNVIKAWGTTFAEDLTCDQTNDITLWGGYNEDFSNIIGYTTLQGILTVKSGSFTVENLIII
jgi:hypothetical protein